MNINQAKYILTILSEGSFSAAANKLFLSQSALSQSPARCAQQVGKVYRLKEHHSHSQPCTADTQGRAFLLNISNH